MSNFNPYEPPRVEADPFASRVAGAVQASRGARFANLVIDVICRFIIGIAFGVVLGLSGVAPSRVLTIGASVVTIIVYYLFFEGLFQATPGKFITGTRVVDLDGNKPSFAQILGRTFARFVPFEPFSFFSDTEDGWHDRWSGTRVVKR
jgi:uncharacterized RDD family membrane protein YckC